MTTNNVTPSFANSGADSWFHIQKVENPVIILSDDAGGNAFSTAFITVPMDTTERIDTNEFTYGGTSGEITVDVAGFYRVTYGVGYDTISTARNQIHGKLQVNTGAGFADQEYCWDSSYNRGSVGMVEGVVTASCVLNLSATDDVRVQVDPVGNTNTHTTTAKQIHLDMEYLGPNLSVANLIRVHDAGGAHNVNAVVTLDWDTEDLLLHLQTSK